MSTEGEFLFTISLNESLHGEKRPYDSREKHLRQVNDIFHLSLLRGDFYRARKAWCVLAKASGSASGGNGNGKGKGKRVPDWKYLWDLGLQLLQGQGAARYRVDYVQSMMFKQSEKELILKETVLHMLRDGRVQEALHELDTYLPSSPYQENTTLHTYAGLCCLYLHQEEKHVQLDPSSFSQTTVDNRSLAMTYFDRALALDSENEVAANFARQLRQEEADGDG